MALTKVLTGGIALDAVDNTILKLDDDYALTGTVTGAGVSTATSTLPSEGGAATTVVAQGLAKAFCLGGNDASLTNSFNISGGTDNGTGDYTYAFSNNFGNNFLSASGNCVSDENVILVFTQDALLAASYRVECRNDSTGDQDEQTTANICGDLA